MQDFDSLKKIWQEDREEVKLVVHPGELSRSSIRNRKWLKNTQLIGGIGQLITAGFICWMIFFGNFGFRFWYTYLSMVMVVLLCLWQAATMLYMFKRIQSIDDTATPTVHLQHWEAYYATRMKIMKIQVPVFIILLTLAIGIYYIEVLSGRPFWPAVTVILITIAWILFSYFYLGKKSIRKEEARLQGLLDELREVEKQFLSDVDPA